MIIPSERMTLTGVDSNCLFGTCRDFGGDFSLVALMRAIALRYENNIACAAAASVVEKTTVRSREDIEYLLSEGLDNVALIIGECHNAFDEAIDFPTDWEADLIINDKTYPINQYLSQFCRTKIYINKTRRRLVVLVDKRATNQWVQALESVICRLMPWYYPNDLTAEDQAFFKAISVDNKTISIEEKIEIFVQFVNKVAEDFDLRSESLKKRLDGVANKAKEEKINSLRRSIDENRRRITSIISDLGATQHDLDIDLLELSGLENSEKDSDEEMINFFTKHKQLQLIEVGGSYLKFGVDDTLEFYDEEEFDRLIQNRSSFLYEYPDDVRKALMAIFLERKGVIRTNAVFFLDNFKLVNPISDLSCISDSMPNPHIYFYGCSGGNAQYYAQYANSGDWDLAIEQAISATKNLSWGDLTVCKDMIRWLMYDNYNPCIYINDDFSPIEKVDKRMKMVNFNDFMSMISDSESKEV